MFGNLKKEDLKDSFRTVRFLYVHEGKVLKEASRLQVKRYYYDGASYWQNVDEHDNIIDVKTDEDFKMYGIKKEN